MGYPKLIKRFYEPLRVLHGLGQTRGKHTVVPRSADPSDQSRRRLLENLAYLCDYEKGGSSTAALALEGQDTGYVIWIASNGASKLAKMQPFLESSIVNIRRVIRGSPEFTEVQFVKQCIDFATDRIKKEQGFLERFIVGAIRSLSQPRSDADQALADWLLGFHGKAPIDLCYLAYDQRKSDHMRLITTRGRPVDDESHQSTLVKTYVGLRHVLGRLASHVRAPKTVISDARRHPNIFDEGVSTVKKVATPSSAPPPAPTNRVTPSSILNRMVGSSHRSMRMYQDAMEFMDQKLQIGDKIRATYAKEDFRPIVHCEVQVLEHFYENNLRFAFNDRSIACSKPACYCCHLYFQAHPAGPEERRSHQKIWLNWGPPLIPDGQRDESRYLHQRDILDRMVETIRKEALSQIERKVTDMGFHPDSTTGITPSVFSDRPLEEQMGNLNIGTPQPDGECNDSDSSDSVHSISSNSVHTANTPDTTPNEVTGHGSWQSHSNGDTVVTGDGATGSSVAGAIDDNIDDTVDATVVVGAESDSDDDDPEEMGGAML